MTLKIIPAIMSGGAGTRLWPLSTKQKPKQFHALLHERTLFAQTLLRVSGDVGDTSFGRPIALCGESHLAHVRAAFAEIRATPSAIVIEPAGRNTAAVAAAAAAVANEIDPNALVLLLPSDHEIEDLAGFHTAIVGATRFAQDRIVTFGISPAHPSSEYGYIKQGAWLGDHVFEIAAFKEKPDQATAETYLAAGDYVWNSGMFLFKPQTLLNEFRHSEEIKERVLESLQQATRRNDEIRLSDAYQLAPRLPFDIAVMEKTALGAVVREDIGWADIGSWAEVWRLTRDDIDFKILGDAAAPDASRMKESGVSTLVIDGEDLVVVSAPDGLLILPRARAADINALRQLADKL